MNPKNNLNQTNQLNNIRETKKCEKIYSDILNIIFFLPIIFGIFYQFLSASLYCNIELIQIFVCSSDFKNLSIIYDIPNISSYISHESSSFMSNTSSYVYIRNTQQPNISFFERVILSDYPDRGYIPLIAATYSYIRPFYILYINGTTITQFPSDTWIENALYQMKAHDAQVVFGCQTTFHNEKVGCSLAIIETTVVSELLFYTNSSSHSIPPLLALSLFSNANPAQLKSMYFPFDGVINDVNYDYIDSSYQSIHSQQCPFHNETNNGSFAILLPQFKRDYIYNFSKKFNEQSILPEFYCIVQCENRIQYNFSIIRNILGTVYHIWCYNWSPLFYFSNHISSIFPVDFVIRYDDDMYSNNTNSHSKVLQLAKGNDLIIGNAFFNLNINQCNYNGNIYCKDIDHVSSPYIFRPFHAKLSGRIIHLTFVYGEDIGICVSSNMLCGTKPSLFGFKVVAFHGDSKSHTTDEIIQNVYKTENITGILLFNIYCHYMKGGYIPKCFENYTAPSSNETKNLLYEHHKMDFN